MGYSMGRGPAGASRLAILTSDKEGDNEVLSRSQPHKLTGLDLAEARLARAMWPRPAPWLARPCLARHSSDASNSLEAIANGARADFILARVAILTGHPDQAVDESRRRWPPARTRD